MSRCLDGDWCLVCNIAFTMVNTMKRTIKLRTSSVLGKYLYYLYNNYCLINYPLWCTYNLVNVLQNGYTRTWFGWNCMFGKAAITSEDLTVCHVLLKVVVTNEYEAANKPCEMSLHSSASLTFNISWIMFAGCLLAIFIQLKCPVLKQRHIPTVIHEAPIRRGPTQLLENGHHKISILHQQE